MKEANKSQVDKFREAARELETDDDEARFNARVGKVAKTPPKQDERKSPRD